MPAVAHVVGEEAPRVVIVLVWEEDAQTIQPLWIGARVVSPDQAKVERSGRRHDGNVREHPSAVVVGQRVDGLQEEGMARDGTHGIVGDTGGHCAAYPGGVGQERVETTITSLFCVSRVNQRQLGHLRRPSQCKFLQNGEAQNILSHRRAGSGTGSRRKSRGTMGIWQTLGLSEHTSNASHILGSDEFARLLIGPELSRGQFLSSAALDSRVITLRTLYS